MTGPRIIVGWHLMRQPISDDVIIDLGFREIIRGGRVCCLSQYEFEIASAIIIRRGTISVEEIFDHLYGLREDGGPETRVIDILIHRLRPKLAVLGIRIVTQWQFGRYADYEPPAVVELPLPAELVAA